MNGKELHSILDAEITKARNGKSKPERTGAIIKAINAKVSFARFQYQAMRATGVSQDFGGLISMRPVIEGKARRIGKKAPVLALRKSA